MEGEEVNPGRLLQAPGGGAQLCADALGPGKGAWHTGRLAEDSLRLDLELRGEPGSDEGAGGEQTPAPGQERYLAQSVREGPV